MLPCYQALPDFLAEHEYQNPDDSEHGPFQKGHHVDIPVWMWATQNPALFNYFNQFVGASRESQNTFLDAFPFEKELCHDVKPDTPLFVDVGGGIGHQCQLLRTRLPHVSGRVVFQDLPPVIAQAPPMEGIEPMIHDFNQEQPIKGLPASSCACCKRDKADENY